MSEERSKRVAVLVHGAWHGAWCWDRVAEELTARDVGVVAPELPLTGLADDTAAVRAAIESAGDNIVVCAHSYGGLVVSGAAKDMAGVRHIVYLAAFMTEEGEGPVALIASHPSSLLEALQTSDDGISVDPARAKDVFYGDSDDDVAAASAARLRPMPADSADAVTPPDPAWMTAPATTYLVAGADQAVAPDLQRRMATHATEVIEWPVDHSPFLTRPGEIADLIVSRFPSP